jgi:hypothetical protein
MVDEDGKTNRDLLIRWSDNGTYPQACQEIVDRVYTDVAQNFPPPDINQSQLTSWMRNAAGVGEGPASQMAALYVLVATAQPAPEAPRKDTPRSTNRNGARSSTQSQRKPARGADRRDETPRQKAEKIEIPSLPTLNVNIQIHIAADTPEEKTRSLIKDMARYFFGREIDE